MKAINVDALRQQMWRAEKLYTAFVAYAKSIGCKVELDGESIVTDDEQARKLATWWTEATS